MYCKDCDFWKRTTDEDREIKRTGSCDCEKHVYGFAPEGGLGYWDLAGYSAVIETDEYFGCVNFKWNGGRKDGD